MAGQEGQAQQVFTLEKGWGLTEGVDFLLLGLNPAKLNPTELSTVNVSQSGYV